MGENRTVLMRHGAFRKHLGKQSLTADVNQAVFFSKGSSYRISHPADYGDRGTVFSPAPRVLSHITLELDPSSEITLNSRFPLSSVPANERILAAPRTRTPPGSGRV